MKQKWEKELNELVGEPTSGSMGVFISKDKIKQFISKLLEQQRQDIVEMLGELKSVDELLDKMGTACKDFANQVSYKEGYNRALKDIKEKYEGS